MEGSDEDGKLRIEFCACGPGTIRARECDQDEDAGFTKARAILLKLGLIRRLLIMLFVQRFVCAEFVHLYHRVIVGRAPVLIDPDWYELCRCTGQHGRQRKLEIKSRRSCARYCIERVPI